MYSRRQKKVKGKRYLAMSVNRNFDLQRQNQPIELKLPVMPLVLNMFFQILKKRSFLYIKSHAQAEDRSYP